MAQRVITQLVSDFSGEDIEDGEGRTVALAFDGVNYRIDLTNGEVAELQAILQPYLDVATRVTGRNRTIGNFKRATAPEDTKAIRAWANKNGFEVGDRGRIPSDARDAYNAAH